MSPRNNRPSIEVVERVSSCANGIPNRGCVHETSATGFIESRGSPASWRSPWRRPFARRQSFSGSRPIRTPTSRVRGLPTPGPSSGSGDVTAGLTAVDVTIPPAAGCRSTSGCEASDFNGFRWGTSRLIQREPAYFREGGQCRSRGSQAQSSSSTKGSPDAQGLIQRFLGGPASASPVLIRRAVTAVGSDLATAGRCPVPSPCCIVVGPYAQAFSPAKLWLGLKNR
mgnify:CR=1 FL=1